MTPILADTDLDNIASERTLEHAGFTRAATDPQLHHYRIPLDAMQA
jgi:hypothetical protein